MNPAFQATVTFAPELARSAGPASPRCPGWVQRLLGPMARVPAELADRSTGLFNRTGLIGTASELIVSRAPQSPFAVVVLDFTDLREVCDIYGHLVARKVIARLVRRLRATAGRRGVVGRTGTAQFTIVLPGSHEDGARRRVQRALGKPARIELDAGDSEIVLVPDVLVDVGEPGVPVQDVYRDICRELARRQKDERRRISWLASERERHSRPMALPQR